MWMNSVGENMHAIRLGFDINKIPLQTGEPAIVIGSGPSVDRYGHLFRVKRCLEEGFDGKVFACDKAFKPCLDAGITPDYVVSVDGDERVTDFFKNTVNHVNLKERPIVIFNAATIHPETFKFVDERFHVYWFQGMVDNPNEKKSVTRVLHYMMRKTMLESLGNVGGMAWHLAYYLGCNPVGLVGLDFGYMAGTKIEDTIYYKAYLHMLELAKEDPLLVDRYYRVITNPDSETEVLVDINWDNYAYVFKLYAKKAWIQSKLRTINCNPSSSLFGEGIEYMPLEEFLKRR